jgi:hypothetical protein
MNFEEALKALGIEEYSERIFNSNSHGELIHLPQYIILAKHFGGQEWFPEWFKETVELAEKNWERPESVFQHIAMLLQKQMNEKPAQ